MAGCYKSAIDVCFYNRQALGGKALHCVSWIDALASIVRSIMRRSYAEANRKHIVKDKAAAGGAQWDEASPEGTDKTTERQTKAY